MKFKKIKYNLICLAMVLFITSAVLLKVFFFDDFISNSDFSQNVPDDEEYDANKPYQPWFDDTEDIEIDTKLQTLTKNPIKTINYCIDKMYNSKGYKTNINFITKVTGSIKGLDVKSTQVCVGVGYKSEDKYLEDMDLRADSWGRKLNGVPNWYVINYFDGTNSHSWRTPENVFDKNKYQYLFTEGRVPYGPERLYYDRLNEPVNFDSNGCTGSIKSQNNSKTGRSEFVVTIKLTNKDYYPNSFLRPYFTFSGTILIKSIDQTISFVIDKESGWIKSFSQRDKFIGDYLGANVTIDLSYSQSFSNINQEIVLPVPEIPQ